VWVSK